MIALKRDGSMVYTHGDTLPADCLQVDAHSVPVIKGFPGQAPATPTPDPAGLAPDPAMQAARMRAAAAARSIK